MTPIKRFSTAGPNGKFFSHLNQVVDRVNSQAPISTPGAEINRTSQGVSVKHKPAAPSGGTSGSEPVWL